MREYEDPMTLLRKINDNGFNKEEQAIAMRVKEL
jgi:hypothetical protein